MESKKTKRYNNIEALRFIFSVIIILFHILHSNIIPYTSEQPLYSKLSGMVGNAGWIVECFLIIGGYFLYTSFVNNPKKTFIDFSISKFIRLWPVFAFSVIISVLFYKQQLQSALMDLFFLRCTGLSLESRGIIWYIGPFFWTTLLIFGILKSFTKEKAALLISVMAFLGYALNINCTQGGFGRDLVFSFISLGFVRVIAGISMGCIIAMAREALIKNRTKNKEKSIVENVLISMAEISLLTILLVYFTTDKIYFDNVFSAVILFVLLFICMLNGNGILSKITDNKFFGCLGKYSYSIYVMQQISFNILKETFWKNTDFLYNHALKSCLISTVFSVIIGIATYYLIEKPAVLLYKKMKKTA